MQKVIVRIYTDADGVQILGKTVKLVVDDIEVLDLPAVTRVTSSVGVNDPTRVTVEMLGRVEYVVEDLAERAE